MKAKVLLLIALTACGLFSAGAGSAEAKDRQYYSSWTYNYDQAYWYRTYYYLTSATATDYSHHYCTYQPSTPRYIYYYNSNSNVYWGRYDLEGKVDSEYSELKDEDKKKELKDIPDAKFPKPAKMPKIPDAKDNATVKAPPKELPPKEIPPKK